jgi:phosphate starvation-inducible PhoH-like protein
MPRKVSTPIKTTAAKPARATRAKKTETNAIVIPVQPKQDLLSQIKIDLKHKNEIQKKLTQSIKNGDVTICTGPAGTGKTLLSVAEALILLKTNPDIYYEIKLVKSIVQLKDEDLGTLPGDERDKLKFIMMSFFDAFYKLIGEELTNKLLEAGYIKMEVFGSIRGRSLSNCIILFDEFQNVTDNNGKTLLTRFSEHTKVIALGDSNQVDLKNPDTSCLAELVRMAKLHPEEGVNVVEFTEAEVVRHRLTRYFINIFEHKDYKKKEQPQRRETDLHPPKPPKSRVIKEEGFFSFLNFFKKNR